MTRIRLTLLLLGVSTALLGPATADAQLGDLIKRKAKEAIKGPAKEQPAATADSEDISAQMKDIYAKDPNVVPITTDQLVRLEKALKFEISERDALQKEKPAKTPEEFQTCSQNVGGSPEAMKLVEDMAKANANATVEALMKAQQKMYEDLAALVAKRCGEDPGQWATKRDARLAGIPGRASDIAKPDGWIPRSAGAMHSAPSGRWGSDAGDSEERIESAQVPHPFLRAYSMLKERIPPFCIAWDLKVIKLQAGTSGAGVRVPDPDTGKGKSPWYIYTSEEASAMAPFCIPLIPLLKFLGDFVYKPWTR